MFIEKSVEVLDKKPFHKLCSTNEEIIVPNLPIFYFLTNLNNE